MMTLLRCDQEKDNIQIIEAIIDFIKKLNPTKLKVLSLGTNIGKLKLWCSDIFSSIDLPNLMIPLLKTLEMKLNQKDAKSLQTLTLILKKFEI